MCDFRCARISSPSSRAGSGEGVPKSRGIVCPAHDVARCFAALLERVDAPLRIFSVSLPCAASATQARLGRTHVCHNGYDPPTWAAVSGGADAPHARGHGEEHVRVASSLSPAPRALLLSQARPSAACAITALPTRYGLAIPSALFRVLLLRRVRLLLPLAPRHCRQGFASALAQTPP